MQRQRPATSQRTMNHLQSDPAINFQPVNSYSKQNKYLIVQCMNTYKRKTTQGNLFSISKIHSQERERARLLPKNIVYDKETLYEEVWKSKEQINKLNEDLKKLKIDNENLERVVRNYENIIQDKEKGIQNRSIVEQGMKTSIANEINHGSIINLKAQIRDCQKQVNLKTSELTALKKDTRITHLQEMEMERTELREECKRLANYIKVKNVQDEQETKNIETSLLYDHEQHTMVTQKNLINAYKQDNIHLSTMIQRLEEEKTITESKNKNQDREMQRALLSQKSYEKQVKELNIHLSYLRSEQASGIGIGSRKLSLKQENEVLKKALTQQTEDNQIMTEQLNGYLKRFLEIETRQHQMEQDQQVIRNLELKEKERLHERMQSLRRENERLEKLLTNNDDDDASQKFFNNVMIDTKQSFVKSNASRPSIRVSMINASQDLLSMRRQSKSAKRKLPRVNHYDISDCCKELRFRLIIGRIDFSQLEDLIVSQSLSYDDQVSINQISEALKSQPFNLEEAEQIHLLSRYLVEDNLEEFVTYDPLRSQEKAIVKSVFKKIIDQYQLFDAQEMINFDNYFANLFNKWKVSMDSALKQLLHKKKHLEQGFCEQDDLDGAFNFCDIQLIPRQREYLDIQIYQDSNSLFLVDVNKMFNKYELIYQGLKHDDTLQSNKIIAVSTERIHIINIDQSFNLKPIPYINREQVIENHNEQEQYEASLDLEQDQLNQYVSQHTSDKNDEDELQVL